MPKAPFTFSFIPSPNVVKYDSNGAPPGNDPITSPIFVNGFSVSVSDSKNDSFAEPNRPLPALLTFLSEVVISFLRLATSSLLIF